MYDGAKQTSVSWCVRLALLSSFVVLIEMLVDSVVCKIIEYNLIEHAVNHAICLRLSRT